MHQDRQFWFEKRNFSAILDCYGNFPGKNEFFLHTNLEKLIKTGKYPKLLKSYRELIGSNLKSIASIS